ncbi:TPA: hypothetical protein PBR05_004082 [Escherichia coli]|nr:hypothetical protein [Escherichia coli]
MTTKATRGRPTRFTREQMADIAYAYYTADRGKEAKEQILSEHGISIAQFYVQIGDGQIVEATGF